MANGVDDTVDLMRWSRAMPSLEVAAHDCTPRLADDTDAWDVEWRWAAWFRDGLAQRLSTVTAHLSQQGFTPAVALDHHLGCSPRPVTEARIAVSGDGAPPATPLAPGQRHRSPPAHMPIFWKGA